MRKEPKGPVYTKHQSQHWDNSAMTLAILFSLKTIVVQKWVPTPFWSDSIVFNENRIASLIAELSQR